MIVALTYGAAFGADLCIRATALHPVTAPVIEDGVVVVRDGRIVAVGPAADTAIPEGCDVHEAAVATPGLVDGFGTAGLTGVQNSVGDQDHRELGATIQPHLRALDGFDPWEPLVGWTLGHGVTTLQIAPSPGPVVAGRTAVVATAPGPAGAQVVIPDGPVVVSFGEPPKWQYAPTEGVRTRMGVAATFRQALASAREYRSGRRLAAKDRPAVDLGTEALAETIGGRRKVIVQAHRADDLLTALRIRDEFDLDMVLAGGAEAYLVREAIAEAGVPVLVGPVMLRSWSPSERTHASFRNAAYLADAGVRVGFGSGFEGYVPKVRVVLWEAAIAATNGLGFERALEALTIGNARILGLERTIGSLEVGKYGDVVLFDGDPFEYTTHVVATVVGGELHAGERRPE